MFPFTVQSHPDSIARLPCFHRKLPINSCLPISPQSSVSSFQLPSQRKLIPLSFFRESTSTTSRSHFPTLTGFAPQAGNLPLWEVALLYFFPTLACDRISPPTCPQTHYTILAMDFCCPFQNISLPLTMSFASGCLDAIQMRTCANCLHSSLAQILLSPDIYVHNIPFPKQKGKLCGKTIISEWVHRHWLQALQDLLKKALKNKKGQMQLWLCEVFLITEEREKAITVTF